MDGPAGGVSVLADEDHGLVCAYAVDGNRKARRLTPEEATKPQKDAVWSWLHFRADDQITKDWFHENTDLDENVIVALTDIGTRPRFEKTPDGLLLILRGVNLNPGRDPEDMVSIRLLIQSDRIVTLRRERVLAIFALRERYEKGEGHEGPGALVIDLANGLVERMSRTIDDLEQDVDKLEELGDVDSARVRRAQILKIRTSSISLKRYLAPQRDALTDFMAAGSELFTEHQRASLRFVTDKITRYVEGLDAIRDRAAAVHEEISAQMAEQMNNTMYRLSIVATIFLPLSLLTGLLGINVGGMPGVESGSAFWWVTISLIVMGIGGYYLMKRWKMI